MSKTRLQTQNISEASMSEEMIARICKQQANMIGKHMDEKFTQFESSMKSMVNQVNENKSKIQNLETRMEHCERMLKMKNFMIYGVEQAADETLGNCENTVIEFLNSVLDFKVLSTEIEQCYRVGKAQIGKPRPILVQFLSMKTKNLVFNKKKMLRNTNYFIKEDLTRAAVETLKSASEKYGKSNVWSQDLVVYDKTDHPQINSNITIGQIFKYYWGLITVIILVAVITIFLPLCGLFFCCCRCCGNCGSRPQPCDKKRDLCSKVIQGTLLILLGTAML
ncbi:unnamed protein product [Phaedon cochleariae]|uniref:Uncharacterized protein n=1 Tax=Phaedon cochleariae TaxID=80249 RepID=A0A9N9X590_PHACE|nr:unnamed protein product [Phaedon cochleariae]